MSEQPIPLEQVAKTLLHNLGAGATGALMGIKEQVFLRVWNATRRADEQQEVRLRFGYEIYQRLREGLDPSTARTWMIIMNPLLDHDSPVTAIAQDRHDEVRAAACAHIGGSAA